MPRQERIRQGDVPGVQLRKRADVVAASAASVWPFLLEPERLTAWLCDRAEAESEAPAALRLERDTAGTVIREYVEVVESRPPNQLILGFRQLDAGWGAATKLTIELVDSQEGCHVAVFQEGFQKLPLSLGLTAWEDARRRWTRALERLREAAGSSPGARA